MDFVLFGYPPEMIQHVINTSDNTKSMIPAETKKSREMFVANKKKGSDQFLDQENLNEVCYPKNLNFQLKSSAK